MTPQPTFAETLRAELERRVKSNPRYSLRAFARDVKMSPSRISEVMNDGQAISRLSVKKICQFLKYSHERTQYFCDLTDVMHSNDPVRKKFAADRLKAAETEQSVYEFTDDGFRFIGDWFHLGLLSLIDTPGFCSDKSWIATRLGISIDQVVACIDRLERLDLIAVDDNELITKRKETRVPDGVSPAAMRKFHDQVLRKAAEALRSQTREERWVTSKFMNIKKESLPELMELCSEFQRRAEEIEKKYGAGDEVYALSSQLFRVTHLH